MKTLQNHQCHPGGPSTFIANAPAARLFQAKSMAGTFKTSDVRNHSRDSHSRMSIAIIALHSMPGSCKGRLKWNLATQICFFAHDPSRFQMFQGSLEHVKENWGICSICGVWATHPAITWHSLLLAWVRVNQLTRQSWALAHLQADTLASTQQLSNKQLDPERLTKILVHIRTICIQIMKNMFKNAQNPPKNCGECLSCQIYKKPLSKFHII